MLPEVHGRSADDMLRRLLLRRGVAEKECESTLARVEEWGSAYLPQVNAFYIREFQMMHAAEDAARFLHHACQGLPHRLNDYPAVGGSDDGNGSRPRRTAVDDFCARVIEHAVAYFGSRVLYPSRPVPPASDAPQLSRAACEKVAHAAIRADKNKCELTAQDWGYRIGSQIYDAYLAGKVAPSSVRRLFLAHLDEPGMARKVCSAVIAKLRAVSRPLARAAHA